MKYPLHRLLLVWEVIILCFPKVVPGLKDGKRLSIVQIDKTAEILQKLVITY